MRSAAVLVLLLALAAPAQATVWRRPVGGPVLRAFAYGPDPFRRGWHRGVDLAAAPGTAVRAACSGTVVTARAVAGAEGVVTLLCGRWRVTHLPLTAIAVRPGAHVPAGARLGLLGTSRVHSGLHLGVRRAGDPFGYVNPLRFLPTGHSPPAPPPVLTTRGRDLGRAPTAAAPVAPPRAAAARAAVAPRPRAAPTGGVRALAPWPAWAGLALLLSGAIAGGLRFRRRRVRAAALPASTARAP
jgi:Peptidase family M23